MKLFCVLFFLILTSLAQTKGKFTRTQAIENMRPFSGVHNPEVDTKTLNGRVMCGYQGWFSTPTDGANRGWEHYGNHKMGPGNCTFDLWPDLSEFTKGEKYLTPFKYKDGSPAYLFSSCHPETVKRHFKWMKEYGIDGVFLQRFGTTIKSTRGFNKRNIVTANVQTGANLYGRSWAMMYDLSGLKKGETSLVIDDWKLLVDRMKILEDKSYQHHDGKPVISIWGVGFNDDRQYTLQECSDLIDFFKNDPKYGRLTVKLGIPTFWREQNRDAVSDESFHKILKKADILSPWTVGRYNNPKNAEKYIRKTASEDVKWAQNTSKGYMPVIFPGFSWQNLKRFRGEEAKLNHIPRLGGEFLWSQAYNHIKQNVKMIYVAMFDEIDEGTAIFKCANKVPVGKSNFLTYEDKPSDHYLWLTGKIKELLNDKIGSEFPSR